MYILLLIDKLVSTNFADFVTPGHDSLMRSIRDGKPSVTEGRKESTISIDVERVAFDGCSLTLFDCAGQVSIRSTLGSIYSCLQQTLARPGRKAIHYYRAT